MEEGWGLGNQGGGSVRATPSHPSDGAIVRRSSSHWCSTNGKQGKLFMATEEIHSSKRMSQKDYEGKEDLIRTHSRAVKRELRGLMKQRSLPTLVSV